MEKYKHVGILGVRSRILRNWEEEFKKICVRTFGDPSWGPMGTQEVKNNGFGVLGGVRTPISGLPYLCPISPS